MMILGDHNAKRCDRLKSNLTEVYLQARAVNVVMTKVNFACYVKFKENENGTTHIKRANAAKTDGRG